MDDDKNKNQPAEKDNPSQENNLGNPQLPNNSEPSDSDIHEKTIEEIEKEIIVEKEKELELVKLKNQKLEEQLRGKGQISPPEISKDEQITKNCNEFLDGTGLKID